MLPKAQLRHPTLPKTQHNPIAQFKEIRSCNIRILRRRSCASNIRKVQEPKKTQPANHGTICSTSIAPVKVNLTRNSTHQRHNNCKPSAKFVKALQKTTAPPNCSSTAPAATSLLQTSRLCIERKRSYRPCQRICNSKVASTTPGTGR